MLRSLAALLVLGSSPLLAGEPGPVARELVGLDRERPYDAVTTIVALGPAAFGELFTILEQGRFEVESEDEPRPLTPLGAAILRDAACEWPAEIVGPRLAARVDPRSSIDLRALLLAHLAAHGGPDDLARLAALAAPDGEADLAEDFGVTLEGIVSRHPDAAARVERHVPRRASALQVSAAHALVTAGDRRALPVIAGWIGVDRRADPLLLERLGALAGRTAPPHDARVLDAARRATSRREPDVRVAAIDALGRLQDVDSVEPLLAALAAEDEVERLAARRALHRIAGVDLGSDAQRWRAWVARVEREWRDGAPEWLEQARALETPAVLAAIRALATRRLHRHEAAEAVAELVDHVDERVRAMACTALGELGSELGRDALRRALDDDEGAVRGTAVAALRRLETRR